MAGRIKTQAQAFEAIAESLREFGYSDATGSMVRDVWAWIWGEGEKSEVAPHGVIGAFAESQLREVRGALATMPPGAME